MNVAQPSQRRRERGTADRHRARWRESLGQFVRGPYLWRVQAMVGLIVVPFYVLEMFQGSPEDDDLLHLAVPVFYALPIILSAIYFRYEGARLTAVLASLLVLPNFLVLVSRGSLGVLAEVGEISLAVVVGLVLARLLEREAAERHRVQDLSDRLAEVHGRLTQAQEDERRSIARELHDVTAQNLVVLSRGLDVLAHEARLPKEVAKALPKLSAVADEVLVDVRRLSRRLRPSILDDLGLVAAARWYAGEVSRRSSLDVRIVVAGQERTLSPDTRLHLYRILQETLHNVEKHAHARQVVAQFTFSDRGLAMTICDDGKGFALPDSLDGYASVGSLGLVGMQERAHIVGGTLHLQSEPGHGTCCLLVVGLDA